MSALPSSEKRLSQIPALQQLINLDYKYLTPEQALAERGGRLGNVLLENTLREQLKRINRIRYKGGEYLFSEENIQAAIQKLKKLEYVSDSLQKTNETVYDLLTLGTSLDQRIEGDTKSFTLNYIDWEKPKNNCFQVTAEFSVERRDGTKTVRPDIVLFVNGIPLAVIECKAPSVGVAEAVSQSIRNQGNTYIPQLFIYAQLVMAVGKDEALYATAGSKKEHWEQWQEHEDREDAADASIHQILTGEQKEGLFSGDFASDRRHFDRLESEGKRLLTERDRAVYSLCRPERLLDLTRRFIVFDSGIKKIARYQQYFVVRSALHRLKQHDSEGRRKGGMVWHTQGSGKSLSMVMLARALALEEEAGNLRIVLVTDRKNLDAQLGNIFIACGLNKERATSGRDLVEHLKNGVNIVTTLIQKFEAALNTTKFCDDSADIIVLVDESHRTNFGQLSAEMRRMLPKACYIGFTGTPLTKKQRNNFVRFGNLIEPSYSFRQAVKDKVVVPLLYEGRHTEIGQNEKAIDKWFNRHTADLNDSQKADLKRKYAHAETLNTAEKVIYMRAYDISYHFREYWRSTGFKAQLAAPRKSIALKYHKFLKQIGYVSSEVIISAPDERDGHEEVDRGVTDEVSQFWREEIGEFRGSEEERDRQIIERFRDSDGDPEILIVVDKLLTGFDAPRNTILYLCRTLREHTLLQAIGRVNRVHESKEFGYIVDYEGTLGELDKALTMYDALEDFDEKDLAGILISINEQISKLSQCHSALWDLFKTIRNRHDEEEFEVLLGDDALRAEFYARLSEYTKILGIALSSEKFIMDEDEDTINRYKNDLKYFQKLRISVSRRYAEVIDYSKIKPNIERLLDTEIQANDVTQLNEPVNIFDKGAVRQIKEEKGIYRDRSIASRADTIAHWLKRAIHEKMEQDPALYKEFSQLIQEAIDDSRAKRISDAKYLAEVSKLHDQFVSGQRYDVPDSIRGNESACAYFGVTKPFYETLNGLGEEKVDELAADTALAMERALKEYRKVGFWDDPDAQKQVCKRMDDFLCDEIKNEHSLPLDDEQLDKIIDELMQIARNRRS